MADSKYAMMADVKAKHYGRSTFDMGADEGEHRMRLGERPFNAEGEPDYDPVHDIDDANRLSDDAGENHAKELEDTIGKSLHPRVRKLVVARYAAGHMSGSIKHALAHQEAHPNFFHSSAKPPMEKAISIIAMPEPSEVYPEYLRRADPYAMLGAARARFYGVVDGERMPATPADLDAIARGDVKAYQANSMVKAAGGLDRAVTEYKRGAAIHLAHARGLDLAKSLSPQIASTIANYYRQIGLDLGHASAALDGRIGRMVLGLGNPPAADGLPPPLSATYQLIKSAVEVGYSAGYARPYVGTVKGAVASVISLLGALDVPTLTKSVDLLHFATMTDLVKSYLAKVARSMRPHQHESEYFSDGKAIAKAHFAHSTETQSHVAQTPEHLGNITQSYIKARRKVDDPEGADEARNYYFKSGYAHQVAAQSGLGHAKRIHPDIEDSMSRHWGAMGGADARIASRGGGVADEGAAVAQGDREARRMIGGSASKPASDEEMSEGQKQTAALVRTSYLNGWKRQNAANAPAPRQAPEPGTGVGSYYGRQTAQQPATVLAAGLHKQLEGMLGFLYGEPVADLVGDYLAKAASYIPRPHEPVYFQNGQRTADYHFNHSPQVAVNVAQTPEELDDIAHTAVRHSSVNYRVDSAQGGLFDNTDDFGDREKTNDFKLGYAHQVAIKSGLGHAKRLHPDIEQHLRGKWQSIGENTGRVNASGMSREGRLQQLADAPKLRQEGRDLGMQEARWLIGNGRPESDDNMTPDQRATANVIAESHADGYVSGYPKGRSKEEDTADTAAFRARQNSPRGDDLGFAKPSLSALGKSLLLKIEILHHLDSNPMKAWGRDTAFRAGMLDEQGKNKLPNTPEELDSFAYRAVAIKNDKHEKQAMLFDPEGDQHKADFKSGFAQTVAHYHGLARATQIYPNVEQEVADANYHEGRRIAPVYYGQYGPEAREELKDPGKLQAHAQSSAESHALWELPHIGSPWPGAEKMKTRPGLEDTAAVMTHHYARGFAERMAELQKLNKAGKSVTPNDAHNAGYVYAHGHNQGRFNQTEEEALPLTAAQQVGVNRAAHFMGGIEHYARDVRGARMQGQEDAGGDPFGTHNGSKIGERYPGEEMPADVKANAKSISHVQVGHLFRHDDIEHDYRGKVEEIKQAMQANHQQGWDDQLKQNDHARRNPQPAMSG